MKDNDRFRWKARWGMWKLRLKIMYLEAAAFARTHPPFKYFFYTLAYFELQERFKRTLNARRQTTPHLTHDDKIAIREQTAQEYQAEQVARIEAARRRALDTEQQGTETQRKMDQFMQFLLREVDPDLAQQYANTIPELVDPEDYQRTIERINAYIDSIMQQHRSDRSTK